MALEREFERFLFEQLNLSRMLRRIIDKGLVEERAFEVDGRGEILRISENGRKVRMQMWALYGSEIERHLGEISERQDAGILVKTLKSLIL